MTKFEAAAEVRQFVAGLGYKKFSVRWRDNPFGGEGLFFVTLKDIPAGVAVVTVSSSTEPTKSYTSDGGVTAGYIDKLRDSLRETNARVGS